MVSEKISILPEGSAARRASGSARKPAIRTRGLGPRRQAEHALGPELVELRHVDVALRRPLPGHGVEPAQPLPGAPALGERLARAEALGDAGEDRVVVPRLADRVDEPVHRDQVVVARRAGDVVALEGRWSTGSTMSACLASAVQNGSLHDDGLGPPPGPHQPVQVLVVVERVAAGPVDEPDVGVGQPPAVEVERLARVEQHVGDPRHRDEALAPGSGPAAGPARGTGGPGWPTPFSGRVAEAEAAARQADLAEHRGQRDRRASRAARRGRCAAPTS